MPAISTLLLILTDPIDEMGVRAALRFGFERARIEVVEGDVGAMASVKPQLVIAGAKDSDDVLEAAQAAPVLLLGAPDGAVDRERAAEVLELPVFVRDVVTLGRVAAGRKVGEPPLWTGKLSEHFGLFYLVRALSAARKRCVLTLVRGLRRGELRFHDGEVTSAQVGPLHGVAALHQLLLWTAASFELRPEELVPPRRQIPLAPGELLAASERFLEEVRDVSGQMSPAHPYEPSRGVDPALLGDMPPQIRAVLRLFDGRRTLVDLIEDSPYRLFETLRIAGRLRATGIIGRGDGAVPAPGSASLAIADWLAGVETAPDAAAADWADVMPRPAPQIEPEAISQVVPATSATGELESSNGAAGSVEVEQSVILEDEEAGGLER